MRPLVVGAPRSGFVLLGSVISQLLPMDPPRFGIKHQLINAAVRHTQDHVSNAIETAFATAGLGDELIYNANFRTLTGGPKWLKADFPSRACIRKYLGVRGMGDFTLVLAHPAEVLETDALIHSHSHPRLWTEREQYRDFLKFASVRNPVGIINSSLFSLNALASEYIQRYVDPRDDNDQLRQNLALFKFTNLDFFTGIVRHYKGYFDEFLPVASRYHVMRWEDLIDDPIETIIRIARKAGLAVEADHAAQVWQRLDHINLTGAHKHNFRQGKGLVGDWKNWMTNAHLDIIRAHGLEAAMGAFGYGRAEPLDETLYTPFQQRVATMLARGQVFEENADRDLFGFAFNKSNLDSSAFAFRRYEWRTHSQVERSGFSDEAVVMSVWEAADAAAGELNSVLEQLVAANYSSEDDALACVEAAIGAAAPIARRMPKSVAAMADELRAAVRQAFADSSVTARFVDDHAPPLLIRAWGEYNVVSYRGRFSAIPLAAGAQDLTRRDPHTIPGAIVRDSYEALWLTLRASVLNSTMVQPMTTRNEDLGTGSNRSLRFVSAPSNPSSWINAVRGLLESGYRTVRARLTDDAAAEIASALAVEFGDAFVVSERNGETPAEATPQPFQRFDATLLIGNDAERISSALLDYLDIPAITLVAPVTTHHFSSRPLYLISIPKAGTHLLFRLAQALGYAAGGISPMQPRGAHWYYLLHSNAHTTTREFFRDELQRAPFGNRDHPFMRSPALFNYRNPLDILVSEANYWHIDGNSPLSVVLGPLSFEERVARLIDDGWLLESIRDRVGEYAAWLDCSNVIPVSFEEIVGGAGGGSDESLDALVWSLQLKLHVPGMPEHIRAAASDRSSPTFREGRINGWRQALPSEAVRQIEALPQDFMDVFGYGASTVLPGRADAYRRRPLKLMPTAHLTVPYLVEPDFLGHNIVSYQQQYYALPLSAGALNLDQMSAESLSTFVADATLASVRARIIAQEVKRQVEPTIEILVSSRFEELRNGYLNDDARASEQASVDPNASNGAPDNAAPISRTTYGDERVGQFQSIGSFLNFNLFRRRDGIIAVPMRLGPVDPTRYELRFTPGVIVSRRSLAIRIRIIRGLFLRILGLRRQETNSIDRTCSEG